MLLMPTNGGGCHTGARLAEVQVVDGMPFVTALRPTIRIRYHPDPSGTEAYTIYDGNTPVGSLRNMSNGAWDVSGYLRENQAAGFVDLLGPPRGCVRNAITHTTVTSQ